MVECLYLIVSGIDINRQELRREEMDILFYKANRKVLKLYAEASIY